MFKQSLLSGSIRVQPYQWVDPDTGLVIPMFIVTVDGFMISANMPWGFLGFMRQDTATTLGRRLVEDLRRRMLLAERGEVVSTCIDVPGHLSVDERSASDHMARVAA